VASHLKYKKPALEGALMMDTPFAHSTPTALTQADKQNAKFVFPAIIAAGKHSYVVRYGPDYYYHATLCDTRPEEIPPFVKVRNSNKAARAFDKEASVF